MAATFSHSYPLLSSTSTALYYQNLGSDPSAPLSTIHQSASYTYYVYVLLIRFTHRLYTTLYYLMLPLLLLPLPLLSPLPLLLLTPLLFIRIRFTNSIGVIPLLSTFSLALLPLYSLIEYDIRIRIRIRFTNSFNELLPFTPYYYIYTYTFFEYVPCKVPLVTRHPARSYNQRILGVKLGLY